MWFIDTDNVVKVVGLRNAETGEYVNDATVTGILYKLPTLHPDTGAAVVDLPPGYVGIYCTGHGMTIGTSIRLERTHNYNGDFILQSGTSLNMLVIAVAYVHEVFTGNEFIYEAIVGTATVPIAFDYISGSDGDYVGKVPRDSPLLQDESYVMCVREVSELEQVLAKIIYSAGFVGI